MKKIYTSSISLLTLIVFMICTSSCAEKKCAANGGGYVDKPPVVKRNHKPQSGLWPKGMKH